jgi:ABC-type phosphate/phosphonate transport system substrate-binding protein
MGFSTSSDISPEQHQVLRQALLNTHNTDASRGMLTRIGLERFDPANATVYARQGWILNKYWGF